MIHKICPIAQTAHQKMLLERRQEAYKAVSCLKVGCSRVIRSVLVRQVI